MNKKKTVLDHVQDAVVTMMADLRAHPDQIEYLRAPGADFVYIEEGLSVLLHDAARAAQPTRQPATASEFYAGGEPAFVLAFGLVMRALEPDGITPPAWYLRTREAKS